jgi:hypothetical protein
MNCDGENSEGRTLANIVSLVTVASAGHFVDIAGCLEPGAPHQSEEHDTKFQIFIQMEGSNCLCELCI